jgi:trk system potassium uptake protein TrkH
VATTTQTLAQRVRRWLAQPRTPQRWTEIVSRITQVCTVIAVLLIVAETAWPTGRVWPTFLFIAPAAIVSVWLFVDPLLRLRLADDPRTHLRASWPDLVTMALCVATFFDANYFRALTLARLGVIALGRFTSPAGGEALTQALLRRPARLLALTFAATIVAGMVLLSLPGATVDGRGTPLVDALFVSTSATCVTGLAVRDPATYLTPFGQGVLLLLVQVGGLGIMTLTTGLALLFGRRVGLRQQVAAHQPFSARDLAPDLRRMLLSVLVITLTIEVLGTLLLLGPFYSLTGDLGTALARAAFHAVSAFCNAGFALQSDSLEALRSDVLANVVVTALIVLGGLGFVAISDLLAHGLPRRHRRWGWRALQVHTRLVLVLSLGLVTAATVYLFFAEFDGALRDLPLGEKAMASFFLSVSSRTAGFNTLPMTELADATLFVLVVFMFIGGSPGGTAGGIKTTTFGILLLTIRATLRGRSDVEVYGRSIPRHRVYTAVATGALAALAVLGAAVALSATQTAGFLPLLFETVSAFATVGLSTGITAELNDVGKVILTLLMFVGRLGPLTLTVALARRASRLPVSYPEAQILVG